MRTYLLLLLITLAGPAAAADWQDAIHQLRGERERAAACLRLLSERADAGRVEQGATLYAEARARMEQVYAGLRAALEEKTPAADPSWRSDLAQAIEARLALCRLLPVPDADTNGVKDVLVAVMEDTRDASAAAVRVLAGQGRADPLRRMTILTQLESTRWPEAREIAASVEITPDEIAGAEPSPEGGEVYPVWFGTNRRPDPAAGGDAVRFTNDRNDRITYGRTEVLVPRAHASARSAPLSGSDCCGSTCGTTGCACKGSPSRTWMPGSRTWTRPWTRPGKTAARPMPWCICTASTSASMTPRSAPPRSAST